MARNNTRNDEIVRSPHSLAEHIKAYAGMIELHLFRTDTSTRRDTNFSVQRWSLPPEDMVHINVDAAMFTSSHQMGIGVVIRNHLGECLAACSELLDEVTVSELAEALVLRRALSLADDEGICKLVVVSDCLSAIQRIQSTAMDRRLVGVVIQDIKEFANNFTNIYFSHVRRQCNESAHILARSAERFVSSVFRNFAPECIRMTLCNDLF
jgi:ribonuclease HI